MLVKGGPESLRNSGIASEYDKNLSWVDRYIPGGEYEAMAVEVTRDIFHHVIRAFHHTGMRINQFLLD